MMTRQKLLDTAEMDFGVQGYVNASKTEIILKVGVEKGTFIILFK
jgi:AcrR family transcriptional regulator